MKKLIPILLLFVLIGCSKESEQFIAEENASDYAAHLAATVLVKNAKTYNNFFTRYGNGWTGGDATYSVQLPDGRNVWTFGDSFLDTVFADRSRPATGLIRNCFVVQDGMGYDDFTTLVTGTIDDPDALVDTPDPDNEWYWPGDGTVSGGDFYVFMLLFNRTGTGGFDFEYVRTDLVKFSLPDITEISRTTVWDSDADVLFGAAIFEEGGYVYVYSPESAGFLKYVQLARYPADDLYAEREYYNAVDETWQSEYPAAEGRLKKTSTSLVDVSAQFSVFYSAGKYRLVTQEGLLGKRIYTYESTTPTGPWTGKTKIYTTPEGPDLLTYNAFVHHDITNAAGYMLMSYNTNPTDFFDLFSNADTYRPKFVWIKYM
ncbi:MAG: DUF5005 domain-containing protein [Chitinophagales bacterium]|nr:DUF5005 domain-containing protein [Chitinophagales bacterium]